MASRSRVVPTLGLIHKSQPARLIELNGGTVRIGRDPSSEIPLPIGTVSSKHALVRGRTDGKYEVEDQNSYNFTYLNGVKLPPFQPMPLEDGSLIRICDFTFHFKLQAVNVTDDPEHGTTILGSIDEISSQTLAARTQQASVVLEAVLSIIRELAGAHDLNEVLARALRELFRVFDQAECGFVLTVEENETLNPRATLRREGSGQSLSVCQTVLRHVLSEGKALLIRDAKAPNPFGAATSLDGTGIRTAVCVPLPGDGGKPIGIIQLDSRKQVVTFRQEDLELLAAVAVPIGMMIENHRMLRERASFAAAAAVQRALLPSRRPALEQYSFWERYQPALMVGGDYYDYIPVERGGDARAVGPGRWAVTIGDVTGKGMPAALLMANLCAEVRHLVRSGAPPDRAVALANAHVCDAVVPGQFVTFALVEIDPATHRLSVVNAGHMAPLVRRADGRVEAIGRVEQSGYFLGLDPDASYETISAELGPGDVVVLYTDGVDEAMNRAGTRFDLARLTRAVAAAPADPKGVGEEVMKALNAHVAGHPQSDDIALVCFGRS